MKLLTKYELAEALKVSLGTIARMRKEGMPSYRFIRAIRFNLDEVLEWLRSREIR